MLGSLMNKKSKTDARVQTQSNGGGGGGSSGGGNRNPFLSRPIPEPAKGLHIFLTQARTSARKYAEKGGMSFPITKMPPFCEIEGRLGVLNVNQRRVAPSGAKHVPNRGIVQAFDCTGLPQQPSMSSGISRSHHVHWTMAGLSQVSPISTALGVVVNKPSEVGKIRNDIQEVEMVETVFSGFAGEKRISVPGVIDAAQTDALPRVGTMEYKEKLVGMDWTLPAAKYDFRMGLASEIQVDPNVRSVPPGWTVQRIKRRRTYYRKDKSIAWQIDVTEVTTTPKDRNVDKSVTYELEFELRPWAMLNLINETDQNKVSRYTQNYAQQLWWILQQINPMEDTVDVEEYLVDHPDKKAVQLALATCGALKKYMDSGGTGQFQSPIATPNETPPAALLNMKFGGCMPVNFSRHNIEEIQNAPSNGYFLSEKTDGVRHFMIFTGSTAVLVDRAMRGKQAKPLQTNSDSSSSSSSSSSSKEDPMASVLSLIQPGTVLDGEVVMFRGNPKQKVPPRPIFIVFDVMCINSTTPVLQLPFENRLSYLKKAAFRTKTANRDMFDEASVANPKIPLPLVRKNFVPRTQISMLLEHVIEEKGLRSFRKGNVHNHLTDGIIFQPNLPYVCGTDHHLLKWKYLDTVTIDVEIMQLRHNDPDGTLRVGVLGDEGTMVDMTRYVSLPKGERFRLEADQFQAGNARIAEVGFDPETGEWYYLTMRPDKVAPNHISTVLGTLLELSESLTTEELQYRMSIPPGSRDTYRKDSRGMLKQLLEHQKKKLHAPGGGGGGGR